MANSRMVRVDVESDLYLPEWVLKAKAKERVARLMALQGATTATILPDHLVGMAANKPVPGVVSVAPRPGKQEAHLIVISNQAMSADHVRDIVGMVREGGYGKGPEFRADKMTKKQWAQTVWNFVDQLREMTKDRGKIKVAV